MSATHLNHENSSSPIKSRTDSHLAALGLVHWSSAICDWQQRFHGAETWLTSAHRSPALTILGLLGRYARLQAIVPDEQVAHDLATLSFAYWHARWPRWVTQGAPTKWQPLVSTFSEFARHHAESLAPQVWVSDVPAVASGRAMSHLLALLPAVRRMPR